MMVETILESSQDFGMSGGPLPQWKRELLQRRALRSRPPAAAPPPPPPPPPPAAPDDDEELRYGPGIVKRLKSRYLSLALRDAPRRRPSVLRRAASLEHLLDEPAPPPPPERVARPPRPASLAVAPPPPHRRDLVKRARSVDALSRLEAREDAQPLSSPPRDRAPPPPRMPRPPRRPPPLLRDTERPPPDLVKSTLRKFEPTAARRPQPAARVSAALRALDTRPRTSTPEPRARSPSPAAADLSAIEDLSSSSVKPVSRAALEGIARAGSTTHYSFDAARRGSHLPPLAAANPVLVGRGARRIGVIRPMPAPQLERATTAPDVQPPPERVEKLVEDSPPRTEEPPLSPRHIASPVTDVPPPTTPPPPVPTEAEADRRETPSAMVEPIPRPSPDATIRTRSPESKIDTAVERETVKPVLEPKPERIVKPELPSKPEPAPRLDVIAKPEPVAKPEAAPRKSPPPMNGHCAARPASAESRIGGALAERAWSGAAEKPPAAATAVSAPRGEEARGGWGRGAARAGRAAPPATSIVFNFSDRKEVPDYIENDGLILRSSRRDRIKPGEAGVVVLDPSLALAERESDSDETDCGPPSPCAVRFVNDNVLINGRSSMPTRPDKTRHARLKLQFDDSLTRTFEYPSETSLCEDGGGEPGSVCSPAVAVAVAVAGGGRRSPPPCSPAPPLSNGDAPHAHPMHRPHLLANTHMASSSLSRYTPSKTCAAEFQLGVSRAPTATAPAPAHTDNHQTDGDHVDSDAELPKENGTTNGDCSKEESGSGESGGEEGGAEGGAWWRNAARTRQPTDLLF